MAFQSVPDCAEIDVHGAWLPGGKVRQMTFYAVRAGGYDLDALQTLVDAVDAWAVASLRPLLAVDFTYLGTEVRGLELENDQVASSGAGFGVGGVATASLPGNVAIAVKRLSGFTGRSARGRVFWFNLGESQVTADIVSTAHGNAILAALDSLDDAVFGAGWQSVIVSRQHNGVVRPVGVVFALVNWALTDFVVDSQRQRIDKSA